jgi:hypothetical protein
VSAIKAVAFSLSQPHHATFLHQFVDLALQSIAIFG